MIKLIVVMAHFLQPICDFLSWYVPATVLDTILHSHWFQGAITGTAVSAGTRIWAYCQGWRATVQRYLTTAFVLCVVFAAGILAGWGGSWTCPGHPSVDKQFAEMYARHASELGCSEGETQSPDDVYEAYYQHAIILWISNPLGSFIQLPAVSDRTIKFYPDPAWGLPMSDTKLRQQSAFSEFPKHCALPFGGVATHWLDNPKDWSWIGCREWHCYLKSVRYQQFEHGIIVGLLPRSYKSEGEPRRGQIFTIVRNGLWSSEDLEVTKYPPSASACTEPPNAPNPK